MRKKSTLKNTSIIIIGLAIISAVFYIDNRFHNQSDKIEISESISTSTPTPNQTQTSTPNNQPETSSTQTQANIQNIASKLQDVVLQNPEISFGISLIDLNSQEKTGINANQIFTAASTTKVFVACLTLHQIEQGQFKLTDTLSGNSIAWHLEQMINQSNNDSWIILMDYLGYPQQTSYAQSIGINTYDYMENTISPNDLALILSKLYTNQILNPEHTKLLLSHMQNTDEERLLPSGLSDKAVFYHKYGVYNENLHDTMILDNGDTPLVLVVCTRSENQDIDRYPVFQEIAQIVESSIN